MGAVERHPHPEAGYCRLYTSRSKGPYKMTHIIRTIVRKSAAGFVWMVGRPV